MPQPKKHIDYAALDALLQFKVSADFCADYLGISKDTIFRRLKEDHGMTFTEYHNLKMQGTAIKLQQKAIDMALKGNSSMMTLSLKNMAGWAEKTEAVVESAPQRLIIDMDDDE